MLTQGLSNSVDAAPELEDVSVATGNDLDTDQENRERRIAIQLQRLDEKLKNEITSLLQVPVVKQDELKTAVKLDILTKLSKSLQNLYSGTHAMVAETCKCNEDLKSEFYDFAYHVSERRTMIWCLESMIWNHRKQKCLMRRRKLLKDYKNTRLIDRD